MMAEEIKQLNQSSSDVLQPINFYRFDKQYHEREQKADQKLRDIQSKIDKLQHLNT